MKRPPARRARCMDDDDWTEWVEHNRNLRAHDWADSPCRDCLIEFYRAMRLKVRCDGQPGGRTPTQKGGRPLAPKRSPEEVWEARRKRWREWKAAKRAELSA